MRSISAPICTGLASCLAAYRPASATARSGDLQTRVILEDVALTLAAIVDGSPSMRVGRKRPLFDAAREAVGAWFGAATSDDRCIGIGGGTVTPRALQRSPHAVATLLGSNANESFDASHALRAAAGALPRGAALLAVGDWYDLHDEHTALLAELGARFDCTALVARDPWYDALPLHGMVRLRGAEGGGVRVFIGARERASYARAVREREAMLLARFAQANWRTGVLLENDGAESLGAAFGLPAAEAAR